MIMINVLNLLWIVPLSASIGMLFGLLCAVGSR